jgi:hypothetical protein
MTTLQQIECVQNNIEDLSIAIQDRLEDADRALTEIPVLIAQRSQERNHLAKLLERRAAELEQLERFENTETAHSIADAEALFGPEIAAQILNEARQRSRG